MALLVQKYGGTSVADSTRIINVAKRIAAAADAGNQVVSVVSAMGNTTDRLIELAHEIAPEPSPRELDFLLSTGEIVSCTLLAMALRELGAKAISLSGAQAGIQTDASHSRARIEQVETRRVLGELEKGNIVIVAGFQGMTTDMETTTLGRGGSDTTAVALAAALKAERCEIYTDVPGVFTADPRVVPTPANWWTSASRRCSSWPATAPACSTPGRWSSGHSTAYLSWSLPASAASRAH